MQVLASVLSRPQVEQATHNAAAAVLANLVANRHVRHRFNGQALVHHLLNSLRVRLQVLLLLTA